jgi:hypothetical protein
MVLIPGIGLSGANGERFGQAISCTSPLRIGLPSLVIGMKCKTKRCQRRKQTNDDTQHHQPPEEASHRDRVRGSLLPAFTV